MTAKKKIEKNNDIKIPAAPSRTVRVVRGLFGVLLASVVVLAVAYVAYSWRHSHTERGQYNISDVYIGDNPAHSLDLNLTAKASYPSAPPSVTQDLGMVDGLDNQIFSFPVKDDHLTEYGLMVWPGTPKPAGGYPVIILLHGYVDPAEYKTTTFYRGDMEFYAKKGFLVVKPDLRGQGISSGHGYPDSAYYSMAYNTDVLSLITSLRGAAYVNKGDINLWGHSMGGYLALRAGVLTKDIKNIIILSGPVDTLEEMYLTYIPPSDENNPYALATRTDVFAKYGTPPDNPQFWYDVSPINFVSRMNSDVQIHAGEEDALIPYRFSEDLSSALARAHVKHELYLYPSGNHGLAAARPLIYSRSMQLLAGQSS